MKTLAFISVIALAAGLTGCVVGPDYHRPTALQNQPLPKAFSDSNPTNQTVWKIAEPSADLPRGQWWRLFNDPELNRLESLALTNNQNLVAAAARLEQARALAAAARSELFPQLTAGGTPGGDYRAPAHQHQRASKRPSHRHGIYLQHVHRTDLSRLGS